MKEKGYIMPRKKSKKSIKAAKKAPKKATKKSSKMQSLSQTHGKKETFEPTTLDQIWGDTGSKKYKTQDVKQYEEQLKAMNITDLQKHATTVGLIPIQNKNLLAKRLLKEFQKHWAAYKKPKPSGNQVKLSRKAKDILAEGK